MGAISLDLGPPGPADSPFGQDIRAIFDREMGVTLHNLKAGSPRDEAMRNLTKEAANLYAKRVLRELIQNAFDGAANAEEPRILLRLDLRQGEHGTLYVANNGQGFTRDNVDAVVSPAMSNKTPGNFIGHKGLGFRSVELLSDDVQIFSVATSGRTGGQFDGFCFRFAQPEDELAWLQEKGEADLAPQIVGRVHRLQLPVPLSPSSPEIDELATFGFATVVKLPLRDPDAAARAVEELRLLFDEKAPITLFLDRLTSLSIEQFERGGGSEVRALSRKAKPLPTSSKGRNLRLEEITVDKKRFLFGQMDVDDALFRESVDASVRARQPVERWRDWSGTPRVSVALPLSADARPGNFYAFLPMDRAAPFNGCLDAPFYPDASRRDLNLTIPLNSFLLDQIADLCLAIAETFADAEETRSVFTNAAVDALAWSDDSGRLLAACERADLDVAGLRFPAMRRKETESRWARLDEIYGWADQDFKIIDGAWLVRVCDLPMLPRRLGEKRTEALTAFIEDADWGLHPSDQNWKEWAPALASDLARRKKLVRREWEDFYDDLASMPSVLPHLKGTPIFRMEDGRLAKANSGDRTEEQELFISPPAEGVARRRQRLGGTTLFPPDSIAKKMVFADPNLVWPLDITKAFFDAQLATEYSLPRVLARMSKLLGKRPKRPSIVAALGWAFAAWKSHKTPEVEQALKAANLLMPVASGANRPASNAYFGAGWKDTRGDLLADFIDTAPEGARTIRIQRDGLLGNWDTWPLKERGTATEWVTFLRLLGVRDGLIPVFFASVSRSAQEWISFRSSDWATLTVEPHLGPHWRAALRTSDPWSGFRYQSGQYETGTTLYALPGQAEHGAMSDRAKTAYARLVVAALTDMALAYLNTRLTKTSGLSDNLAWPSPLAAFLQLAAWLPVGGAEDLAWQPPTECWFSPRAEPLPRFVPRIDRSVRDTLEMSQAARDLATSHLGLRLWSDPSTATSRLRALGQILANGIGEADHDTFRKVYREAWADWHGLEPRPWLPSDLTLAVQVGGRLRALPLSKDDTERPVVFLSDGADHMREQLVTALGHMVLPLTPGVIPEAAEALERSAGEGFRPLPTADLIIRADGAIVLPGAETPQLVVPGREWLAEIAVLVLEFNEGLTNRNTARARQALYDDFRKLRVVFAKEVTVEIDDREGPLPDVLDGVLAIPHAEFPTLVVESISDDLDWSTLARLSRGLPMALGRPSLALPFRVAFLELERLQSSLPGRLDRPDDRSVAQALNSTLPRVQEIYRSLRSTNRRLFDSLIPAAHVLVGPEAAHAVLAKDDLLLEDVEISAILLMHGADAAVALSMIAVCRDAEGLDEARRSLGIDLITFNAALTQLGGRWSPLRFESRLKAQFEKRKEARRPELQQSVRDAFVDNFDQDENLSAYNENRRLDWAIFDDDWVEEFDELTDDLIDARIAKLAGDVLPESSAAGDAPLDIVRQRNRALLLPNIESLRLLTSAWVSKEEILRQLPQGWKQDVEQIAREVMSSGALDFRFLAPGDAPKALQRTGLWPTGMPASSDLALLGLEASDLERRVEAEQQAQLAFLKGRRSVTFGGTTVDGGGERPFQLVADALNDALGSKDFQSRSGKPRLLPFGEPGTRGGNPGKRTRTRDPEYMSEEQRTLLGFAGELAAYTYLRRTVRAFADAHWISSMGRRYLGLAPTGDADGYDFHVPRSRGPDLFYEVKAHTGDPGYIDLERSQVAAAISMADGRAGIWSVLYVPYVRNPQLITVQELVNPFTIENRSLYRQSGKQATRLEMKRA